MLNQANQHHFQFTWQALLWRLLLTMLLLLILAGPGLTAFTAVTTDAGTCALPTIAVNQGEK